MRQPHRITHPSRRASRPIMGVASGRKQRLIFAVDGRWSSANNYQVGQCNVAYNACIVKRPALVWRVFARYSSRGVLELIAFHAHFRVQSSQSFRRGCPSIAAAIAKPSAEKWFLTTSRSSAAQHTRFPTLFLGLAGLPARAHCRDHDRYATHGGPHRAASDRHAVGSHTEGGESSNRSVDQSTPPFAD